MSKPDPKKTIVLKKLQNLYESIWFFPVVLLMPLLVATVFQINGSSIGVYHEILYGKQTKDIKLLANTPRSIRSDEWLVTTQQTLAQSENNYLRHNKNIGDGQDMSTTDVPYKDWSIVFKPHNLIFFILPFGNAFAFKWWFMGYLLIVSAYLFVIYLLPKRKLLAALLSVTLFFSAFIQWWYTYGTLGSIYYSLFIALVLMSFIKTDSKRWKIALLTILVYLLVCFVLVLYPPFQISCGLVLAIFFIGYCLINYPKLGKTKMLKNIFLLVIAGVISIAIVSLYIFTRINVVRTINNTAYPGQRSMQSGTFFPQHFMSSHLGYQFLSENRTAKYLIDNKSPSNQSESSNFLILIPFLIIPSLLLLYYGYKENNSIDWPLFGILILFLVFMLHLFVPSFTPVAKLFLLNKVGNARLLIGVGLLNLMAIVLFIRGYSKLKRNLPSFFIVTYSLVILAIELIISLRAYWDFDGFISFNRALIFSIPLPLTIYLLLKKRFLWAICIYTFTSIIISIRINPLYKGVDVITKNPVSTTVKEIGLSSNKRWVSDGGVLENLASINGEPSLSGVYLYPQFSLWSDIPGVEESVYNRYAHVGFQYYNAETKPTELNLVTADSFVVKTPICGDYIENKNVGYVISSALIQNNCVKFIKEIPYPSLTLYVYELRF